MLVLSRRPEEKILIPSCDIVIHVLETQGLSVRLGIEAPPEVRILRAELAGTPRARKRPSLAGRTRVEKIRVGLERFRRQWQEGRADEAESTLGMVFEVLDALERDLSDTPAAVTA